MPSGFLPRISNFSDPFPFQISDYWVNAYINPKGITAMTSSNHIRVALILLILPILGALPVNTRAATITVTSTADSGAGTLRAALASAANGDTINFSLPTPATITLTNGELFITNDLAITGPGAVNLAIGGNTNSRVFNIASNCTVTLSGLAIRDGQG